MYKLLIQELPSRSLGMIVSTINMYIYIKRSFQKLYSESLEMVVNLNMLYINK